MAESNPQAEADIVSPFEAFNERSERAPLPANRTVAGLIEDVTVIPVAGGEAVVYSCVSPIKETRNEDAWVVQPLGDRVGVLGVADGLGGHRGGRVASRLVTNTI
ncbi:MAG: hypothetical protein KDA66_13970, partial [Planctomycetaceae bacterium]|nr:hypothetical protein [Planctomycetaceae bacterium]